MILHARDNGVPFGWIGMDSFYGEQPWLRNEIDSKGMIYIADIPVNTRVWLNKPETGIPERRGDHGRIPTKEKVLEGEPDPIEVKKLKDQLEASEWGHVFVPAAMLRIQRHRTEGAMVEYRVYSRVSSG